MDLLLRWFDQLFLSQICFSQLECPGLTENHQKVAKIEVFGDFSKRALLVLTILHLNVEQNNAKKLEDKSCKTLLVLEI